MGCCSYERGGKKFETEKWFYQTTDGNNYILTAAEFDNENGGHGGGVDDEATPRRTIRHKSHIPKVMFLCVQA